LQKIFLFYGYAADVEVNWLVVAMTEDRNLVTITAMGERGGGVLTCDERSVGSREASDDFHLYATSNTSDLVGE